MTLQKKTSIISIIFRTKSTNRSPRPKLLSHAPKKNDFKVQVIVNNSLDSVIADTGARVSLCGTSQAQKWNLLDKMVPSSIKIKLYKSKPIPVYGIACCAVTFGETSIPVEWHIIAGSCEPILSGDKALQLGIIHFTQKADTFRPILMIDRHTKGKDQDSLQKILGVYPQNFTELGKL